MNAHTVVSTSDLQDRWLTLRDAEPRLFSVDLSAFGIRKPPYGPMLETFMTGRIPVFDQGAIRLIRQRAIRIVDGNLRPILTFTRDGVQLGSSAERFDTVLLATGFEPRLGEFIDDHQTLLGTVRWRRNFPLTDGRCRSRPVSSAFFPGFDQSVNGGLSLGRWGWEVGERIAAEFHA